MTVSSNSSVTGIGGGASEAYGPYVNSSALEAAYPAASNTGKFGLVGASAPYTLYSSSGTAWGALGTGGTGTVTSVSVTTANGVSGTVATATTTPAISLTLGAITPTSVAATGGVSGSNLSGTNTGDETLSSIKTKLGITTLSGSNTGDQTITLTGDVSGTGSSSFATTLANTSVVPGSYTSANITVDSKGRITSATNGSSGSSFPTNSAVVYIHPNGNDGTAVVGDPTKPFLTLNNAISGRGTSTTFAIAQGTYNCGSGPVIWPAGSWVWCEPGTIWTFDGTLNVGSSRRCCVEVAPGTAETHIFDARIDVALSGIVTCGPVGFNSASANAYPDLHLWRVQINAQTDILYMGGLSTGNIYAHDCKFKSAWDILYCNTSAGGVNFYLDNCQLLWAPRRDVNSLNALTWAQVLGLGTASFNGGCIIYDTTVSNTTTTPSQWMGINLVDGGGSYINKLSFGGGFRRINTQPGDMLVPFYVGGSTGSPSLVGVHVNSPVGVDLMDYTILSGIKNAPPLILSSNFTYNASWQLYGGSTVTTRHSGWKLSAAALTQTFNLFTLPPGVILEKVWLERRTAVAGVTTCTVELGIVGNTTKYLAATDVKTTGVSSVSTPNVSESFGDPSTTNGTVVIATVRSTGSNLSSVTGGDFIIRMSFSGVAPDTGSVA